jgi:hypothetical protein
MELFSEIPLRFLSRFVSFFGSDGAQYRHAVYQDHLHYRWQWRDCSQFGNL